MENFIRFTNPDTEMDVVFDIHPDLARNLYHAICGESAQPPRIREYSTLLQLISQTESLMAYLRESQEFNILAADSITPNADRTDIARRAGMPTSRLYRLLAKNGHPRNRRPAES